MKKKLYFCIRKRWETTIINPLTKKGTTTMNEQEIAQFRDETRTRLENTLGMTETQAKFVIALTKNYHCTLGAALYAINDYMDKIDL